MRHEPGLSDRNVNLISVIADIARITDTRSSHCAKALKKLVTALLAVIAFAGMTMNAFATCRTASPGSEQWKNEAFNPESGELTVQFNATPLAANMDGLIGITSGPATNWTQLAAIVRFNQDGFIDARNGSAYGPSKLPYSANTTYHFRVVLNVPAHTYSVWARGWESEVSGETQIAQDYSFRTEQLGVSSLNNSVVEAEIGSLKVCDFAEASGVQPVADCTTAMPGVDQWQAAGLPEPLHVGFTARWDVTPLAAGSDALIALANGPQTTWTGLAAIARFNSDNTIDVRDGSVYRADTVLTYEPGKTYRITMSGDVENADGYPGHTYSVSVSSADGLNPVEIAHRYHFRTEQQAVTELNHRIVEAEQGGVQACNFFYQIQSR